MTEQIEYIKFDRYFMNHVSCCCDRYQIEDIYQIDALKDDFQKVLDVVKPIKTERACTDAEKEKAVDEIMALVKQAVKAEKEALAKMRELDDKYGFGTAAKEMLERVDAPKKYEDFCEPFCMKVKVPVPTNIKSQDAFVNSLRDFLGK